MGEWLKVLVLLVFCTIKEDMARNPASGRVLQKLGMRQEGLLRDRVRKWDIFEDVCLYAMLEEEWRNANS